MLPDMVVNLALYSYQLQNEIGICIITIQTHTYTNSKYFHYYIYYWSSYAWFYFWSFWGEGAAFAGSLQSKIKSCVGPYSWVAIAFLMWAKVEYFRWGLNIVTASKQRKELHGQTAWRIASLFPWFMILYHEKAWELLLGIK